MNELTRQRENNIEIIAQHIKDNGGLTHVALLAKKLYLFANISQNLAMWNFMLKYLRIFIFLCLSSSTLAKAPEHNALSKEDSKPNPIELKALAEQGNADAQMMLGVMYYYGEQNISQDLKKAYSLFTKAARQNNALANFFLGVMYLTGDGAPQDNTQGINLIIKSASQGEAKAQYLLGSFYFKGEYVLKDVKQATEWLTKAANQGDADAQFILGMNCTIDDFKTAANWYTKAAIQGHKDAQYELARMYERGQKYYGGRGIPQDYRLAIDWYTKSAEQGNAKAQINLGLIYDLGQGVTKDRKHALSWYRKAIKQSDSITLAQLGVMYCEANRAPLDCGIGYALLNLSIDQGESSAVKARDVFSKRMSAAEIKRGQELINELAEPEEKSK